MNDIKTPKTLSGDQDGSQTIYSFSIYMSLVMEKIQGKERENEKNLIWGKTREIIAKKDMEVVIVP